MRIILFTLLFLFFTQPLFADHYVFIEITDKTGFTADDDKSVSKRGDIVAIDEVVGVPSQKEQDNYLIFRVSNLTQPDIEMLLENWGNSIEDRDNYKSERRYTIDADWLETNLGISNGLYPTTIDWNTISNRVRLKTEQDLARYESLRRSRYVKRLIEYAWLKIDNKLTPNAYAETITTICNSGCTYTTMGTWESTEGGGGTLSEIKTGQVKDDSGVEDCGALNIDGQTTDASNYMRLTVASGERHNGAETDGASGNGVLINHNTGNECININDDHTEVSWVQIKGDGTQRRSLIAAGANTGIKIHNFIIRDFDSNRGAFRMYNTVGNVMNGLIHDIATDSCFLVEQNSANITAYNITIDGCGQDGFERANTSTFLIHNSVACNADGASTDFEPDISSSSDNLASCDDTADDTTPTTSYINLTDTTIFTDPNNATTADFTPKSGGDLIDNGTDYGTTPTNVNIDLKGRDRDSEGDTWDIGAIESVSGGVSFTPKMIITKLERLL